VSAGPRPAVIVFCRAPVPGRTKTRLSPAYPPEQAAALGVAMLLDVTAALSSGELELSAAVARAEDRGPVAALVPPDCAVAVQSDGDLGQRMRNAIRRGLGDGHPAVALVGSDCPEVTVDLVGAAFTALKDDADLVISPSGDGGYSLIAAASDIGPVFEGIAWSTARVIDMTRAAAAAADLRMVELGPLNDVDRAEDVARLAGDSLRPSAAAVRTRAVATALAARDRDWHSQVESANHPSLYSRFDEEVACRSTSTRARRAERHSRSCRA